MKLQDKCQMEEFLAKPQTNLLEGGMLEDRGREGIF